MAPMSTDTTTMSTDTSATTGSAVGADTTTAQ
jgi:hypothetical protein